MAKRRMFTLDIVDSDAFLTLPLSAQALYFHLGMRADDDGFVGKPITIMKTIGANNGDIEILINKKFLLYFQNEGVIVVKHWWMHNQKRKDRYNETTYKEIAETLYLNENKAYTLVNTKNKYLKLENNTWQENGNQMAPQDKLNKDKLSKDNISKGNNNDITRYKHSEECKKLYEKLLSIGYVDEFDLEEDDYLAYFDNRIEDYGIKDVKIKLDYFINQVSHPFNNNGELIYKLNEEAENISNRFLYLKMAMDNGFRKIERMKEND